MKALPVTALTFAKRNRGRYSNASQRWHRNHVRHVLSFVWNKFKTRVVVVNECRIRELVIGAVSLTIEGIWVALWQIKEATIHHEVPIDMGNAVRGQAFYFKLELLNSPGRISTALHVERADMIIFWTLIRKKRVIQW